MITYDNFLDNLSNTKSMEVSGWTFVEIGEVSISGNDHISYILHGKETETDFTHIKEFLSRDSAKLWLKEHSVTLARLKEGGKIGKVKA